MSSVEYLRLRSSESQEELYEDPSESHSPLLHQSRNVRKSISRRLIVLACIGTLISSTISITLGARELVTYLHDRKSKDIPFNSLRRPNSYINLDKISNIQKQPFSSILNFPRIVFQLDNSGLRRMTIEDHRSWFSELGTVYPHDRHIEISRDISTILHFRHMDFGMESCVLHMRLQNSPGNPASPLMNTSGINKVNVWRLDTNDEIFADTIHSSNFPPRRRNLLTNFTFMDQTPSSAFKFHCAFNEFTTLELSCADVEPRCAVDFWQNHIISQNFGIYVVQYPTSGVINLPANP
ncbi:hypothetical protein M422DRAFT_779431 [Sphaerobolus stellatus SS14]|uniref:Ubiquitin 3 binding protein But2 C-terminal domain-containing protein n=1 Tax=Sphaerobolus stellatus (strain SS14) TaxID=990650 RepID=A0A0C9W0C2_SPHS4|nr:hypothetical protein M422DRAFT_779431 [Sphaerobolus stellatus SS14]